jgi:hypothetical protein
VFEVDTVVDDGDRDVLRPGLCPCAADPYVLPGHLAAERGHVFQVPRRVSEGRSDFASVLRDEVRGGENDLGACREVVREGDQVRPEGSAVRIRHDVLIPRPFNSPADCQLHVTEDEVPLALARPWREPDDDFAVNGPNEPRGRFAHDGRARFGIPQTHVHTGLGRRRPRGFPHCEGAVPEEERAACMDDRCSAFEGIERGLRHRSRCTDAGEDRSLRSGGTGILVDELKRNRRSVESRDVHQIGHPPASRGRRSRPLVCRLGVQPGRLDRLVLFEAVDEVRQVGSPRVPRTE